MAAAPSRTRRDLCRKRQLIDASAVANGNGGTVIVWSNESTKAYGRIAARGGKNGGDGGFVETSGHYLDVAGVRVDTSAAKGTNGTWLLDPFDITIVDGGAGGSTNGAFDAGNPNTFTPSATGSTVTDQDINDNLVTTDVVISTVNGGGAENGDITVNADVSIVGANGNDLTLRADRHITFNNPVAPTTIINLDGALNLLIGQTPATPGTLTIPANVDLTATGINVTGAGGNDTVAVTPDANFTLTDSSLAVSGAYTLNLSSVEIANLTGGGSANTFTVSGWTGTGTLNGAGGTDSVIATNDVTTITLTDASLARTGLGTLTLASIDSATLAGGPGDNSIDASGFTGTVTVNATAGTDSVTGNGANTTFNGLNAVSTWDTHRSQRRDLYVRWQHYDLDGCGQLGWRVRRRHVQSWTFRRECVR